MKDIRTLRISNTPPGLLTSSGSGLFSFEIPAHLRHTPCYIKVVSGIVTNLESIFEAAENPDLCFIRHNIPTNSYDVTSKGINRSFGTIIRPASTEKAGGIQLVGDLVIGQATLPPLMEIELIGYITATGAEVRLDKAASTIEIILELDYSTC
tara:strand:- start:44 stop:502 length:459 start_codon:yes stop_codon:yes gene_type:complete